VPQHLIAEQLDRQRRGSAEALRKFVEQLEAPASPAALTASSTISRTGVRRHCKKTR